jgi:predicted nucleic acid-binding protein
MESSCFSNIAAPWGRAFGRPVSHADAQIASIAKVRVAKLATLNVADFAEGDGCRQGDGGDGQ